MSFQSPLEAIRFLLMSECEWQKIPCSGTMVGKRTLTIGLWYDIGSAQDTGI